MLNSQVFLHTDLSYLPSLPEATVLLLLPKCPSITYLSLEKSYNAATDLVLAALASNCRELKTASLSYCTQITDQGLAHIGSGLRDLKELSLAHCYELTSEGLCSVVRNLHHLIVLSLECK